VLAFVGGFLVVLAILAQAYAPGALEKTPIDVNTTTELEGTAQLPDASGVLKELPVKAYSITHTDSAKSDDDVAVFVNFACLVKDEGGISSCVSADDPQDRLINASADNFAADRVTAIAVNDPKYLPADAVPHEGLVNKWPFHSKKTTYPYWDSVLGTTVDAVYDRTETIDGVRCYVYIATVTDQPAEVSNGIQGTYTDQKEFFIEPLTGGIVDQREHQQRFTGTGDVLLDLSLAFTKDQVATFADDIGGQADQLDLLTTTVPVVGYVVGIPMLLAGLALLFLGRNRKDEPPAPKRQPVAAGTK